MYDNKIVKYENIYDNTLVIPSNEYKWIYNVCFIHINHIAFAFYYEMNICGYMGVILFGTSINYWRYPLKISIRRYIDITWVSITFSYHIYLSLYLQNLLFIITITLAVLMYPLSNYFLYNHKNYKYSAFLHCLVHVFASIGACVLYKDSYEKYINYNNTLLQINNKPF